jgi:hypothetical protein
MRAYRLPCSAAFVLRVIEVCARMLPLNAVLVPKVEELPTCHRILHGSAPLITATLASGAVVSVLTVWKMKTLLGLPNALRVSVPVSWAEDVKQYTPGVRVKPPRS